MEQQGMISDIEPGKFFVELVPAGFEKNAHLFPKELGSLRASISFELSGAGGGVWTLSMHSGKLIGEKGEDPERILKLIQSREDWACSMRGEKGFRLELPGEGSGKNLSQELLLNQEKIERLKSIKGSIKFKLTDLVKGDWEITAVFGPETHPEPDCTITMGAADALAIREGKLSPQTAFMAGKINIKGDMGLALQIGAVLMS